MEILGLMFFIIFPIAFIVLIIVGYMFIRVWLKAGKRILFHYGGESEEENKEDKGAENRGKGSHIHVDEKKKTKRNTVGIAIIVGISIIYYLSEYLFSFPALPNASIILAALLTLAFCFYSIFCKSQYTRLFLIGLGFIGTKLTVYYCDFVLLTYDLETHSRINLIAYYVIKYLTIINLIVYIIKGIKIIFGKGFRKINKTTDKIGNAITNHIDNSMKYYKATVSGYGVYQDPEERIRESGEQGEANVRYHLNWLDGYKVLHNVRLPNPLESQEFDHIVIGKNGVFHLETKNHGGKYGAEIVINEEGDWSIIRNGDPAGMENPLSQVRRHERVLREFLEKEFPQLNIPIKEIVVLSNEKTILEGQENAPITVLKVERLNDFILDYESDVSLDDQTVESIFAKIAKYSRNNRNSKIAQRMYS